jgi:hypothetical protein
MNVHDRRIEMSEPLRQKIFLALVSAQDQETDVAESRKLMAQRFGVSESQIRQIEREGLQNKRPPLD